VRWVKHAAKQMHHHPGHRCSDQQAERQTEAEQDKRFAPYEGANAVYRCAQRQKDCVGSGPLASAEPGCQPHKRDGKCHLDAPSARQSTAVSLEPIRCTACEMSVMRKGEAGPSAVGCRSSSRLGDARGARATLAQISGRLVSA
jgi:hypothetical protein